MKKIAFGVAIVLLVSVAGLTLIAGYQLYKFTRPVETTALLTPWTESVDRAAPLPEYPRPHLRRDRWQSLNGIWQYAVTTRQALAPVQFNGSIVVPFAIESRLSGVQRSLLPEDRLWYRRVFEAPPLGNGERLMLHFGAVDWEAEVWLNGERMGVHQGGFDPFSFDVTEALNEESAQELVVAVWDPTNTGSGAVGKQHLVPHGIRYTAVSGIWQTVWLEPVPAQRILNVAVMDTDLSAGSVTLAVGSHDTRPGDEIEVEVRANDGVVTTGRDVARAEGVSLQLSPPGLRAWSPEDPFLYDLEVTLWRNGEILDQAWDLIAAQLFDSPNVSLERSPESEGHFRRELAAMIAGLQSFPSIVAWVPFNEAWGQFDTDEVLFEVGAMDSTRLVDGPSGWIDTGSGDIRDLHMYGREAEFVSRLPTRRPLVYGEFGGLGYPVDGHLAVESGWGYSELESEVALEAAYVDLLGLIERLQPQGLAGAIYTQTTDVESEINGLITYDRRRFKIPPERLAQINERLATVLAPPAAVHLK